MMQYLGSFVVIFRIYDNKWYYIWQVGFTIIHIIISYVGVRWIINDNKGWWRFLVILNKRKYYIKVFLSDFIKGWKTRVLTLYYFVIGNFLDWYPFVDGHEGMLHGDIGPFSFHWRRQNFERPEPISLTLDTSHVIILLLFMLLFFIRAEKHWVKIFLIFMILKVSRCNNSTREEQV